MTEVKGSVFEIQRFCLHDGPGIRTTVFLKGCPLRCAWCANPESQSQEREIFYRARDCMRCGICVEACPKKAIQFDSGNIFLDRTKCDSCAACVDACPKSLFQIKGQSMTCADVAEIVQRDRPFFDASGGGMTISGGEPIAQKDFVLQLLLRMKALGISTCIETSLYGSFDAITALLPLLDNILFDVKHWDNNRHRCLTGKDNDVIAKNIRSLLEMRPDAIARIPVIPGFNDSEEDIKNMASYLERLEVKRIQLLPFHNLATQKYNALGRKYDYSKIASLEEKVLQKNCAAYRAEGFAVLNGGN